MDLPGASFEPGPDDDPAHAGIDNPGLDFNDIVESIYYDKGLLQVGLPDSPPDSNPEKYQFSPELPPVQILEPDDLDVDLPDIQRIDYSLPLELIQGGSNLETQPGPPPHLSHQPAVGQILDGGALPSLKVERESPQLSSTRSSEPERNKGRKREVAPLAPIHEEKAVKLEPADSPLGLTQPSNMSTNNGLLQSRSNIQFAQHQPSSWNRMFTANRLEISFPKLTVCADKGFNFSGLDSAFIAQKKNHFQVSVQIEAMPADVAYVRTRDGNLHRLNDIQINFYGIKLDVPTSYIRVEQSQTDRSKVPFHPVPVSLVAERATKVCIGRLHFTETTANNMRKKGRPNPAQKYFQLVVSLDGVICKGTSCQKEVCLSAMVSERIIVRASNPGQFENEPASVTSNAMPAGAVTPADPDRSAGSGQAAWSKSGDKVYHMGHVGINTEQPSEALSVQGNIQLTGQILQPSDLRIKERIREIDSKRQLENVNQIKIVQYKYKPEFVDGLPDKQQKDLTHRPHTGVIAQDVRRILPDAVSSVGQFSMKNGATLDEMLIVNKDRLFLENIGAVRELSKMTDTLETRIDDLEKANEKVSVRLSRIRKGAKVSASSTSLSTSETSSEAPSEEFRRAPYRRTRSKSGSSTSSLASQLMGNRMFQGVIIALCTIMAVSLVTIAIVYLLDYFKASEPEIQLLEAELLNKTSPRSESSTMTSTLSTLLPTTTTTTQQTTSTAKIKQSATPRANANISRASSATTTPIIPSSPALTTSSAQATPAVAIGSHSNCEGDDCSVLCCSHTNLERQIDLTQPGAGQVSQSIDDNNLTSPGPREESSSSTSRSGPPVDDQDFLDSLPQGMVLALAETTRDPDKEFSANVQDGEANDVENDEPVEVDDKKQDTNDITENSVKEKVQGDEDDSSNLTITGSPDANVVISQDTEEQQSVRNEVDENERSREKGREIRQLKKDEPAREKDNQNDVGYDEHKDETSSERYAFNEVTTTEKQRAKRNVERLVTKFGTLVKTIIRKIRNVNDTDYMDGVTPSIPIEGCDAVQPATTSASSGLSIELITSESGNYTLGSNYCVSNQTFLTNNVSLVVPVSKYFSEDNVTLEFAECVEICADIPDGTTCATNTQANRQQSGPAASVNVGAQRAFEVSIGQTTSKRFRFRSSLAGGNHSPTSVCSLPPDQLGSGVKEYNLLFHRLCE